MQANNLKIVWFLTIVILGFQNGFSQIYSTNSGHAEFNASTYLHDYTGKSDQLEGTINFTTQKVSFSLQLNTLETGIGQRDRQMLKVLETTRFPKAIFIGEITNNFPENFESNKSDRQVEVIGQFTIHGVAKPIKVTGTLTPNDNQLTVKASWQMLITDYDIKPPGILFYTVRDEHKITIDAVLEEK